MIRTWWGMCRVPAGLDGMRTALLLLGAMAASGCAHNRAAPSVAMRPECTATDAAAPCPFIIRLNRVDSIAVPRYPPALVAANHPGRVMVSFWVDSTGRVDLSKVQVLQGTNPSFVESVKEVLARWSFDLPKAARQRSSWRQHLTISFILTGEECKPDGAPQRNVTWLAGPAPEMTVTACRRLLAPAH